MVPIAVTEPIGAALQHQKHSIELAGIKGYEKFRMQIAKIRKNQFAISSEGILFSNFQASGYGILALPGLRV